MKKKSIVALAIAALTSGALAVTNATAAQPHAISDGNELVTPAWMPLGVGDQNVTVVVQMTGESVAEQQGNAGRKLSNGEKDQIKQQLRAGQDKLRGSIAGLGGEVVAHYEAAYNGMKVRIARAKVGELAKLPGVVAVRSVRLMQPDNVHSIPYLGVPGVWAANPGLRGEGVKIAIIDTGIDYTHANFGGPGTKAAYAAAHAHETDPADPSLFGPNAPRVKGGIDLVGDSYNANPNSATYQPIPHPDPNPLDCNEHGSHVAGTAAGSGVTAAGATYTGNYTATTVSGNSWTIGPGVAPKADLYAIRVFGCNGSTDVVVDAIDWAVDHDMDVINMSLGAAFGSKDDPDAVATTNAAKAGIVVVASAGNSGANPYVIGSPSIAAGAIAVAATDSNETFPGANIAVSSSNISAINANGFPLSPSAAYTVKVITNKGANEQLGCSVAAFGGPLPPNTVAVVRRGTCARVSKAIFGQQAGAAAVVMVNSAAGLPPFEGPITSNPDDGVPFVVTIPFLGVPSSAATGGILLASNGLPATVTPAQIANPAFQNFASFSSRGPRSGDSGLKPDITAPGVSIISTQNGSGNGALALSGTSMASPHVAGVAALTREAHPNWSVADLKAAIVDTGDPSQVANYQTSLGGTGLVQPANSTRSQVTASADGEPFAVSVNYGFAELSSDFTEKKTITLRNNGSTPATFNVAEALPSGTPHSISLDKSSVTVPAGGKTSVKVTLNVPVAGVAPSNDGGLDFNEVAGLVEFTPAAASDNGGVTLRVPYYFVPRALSSVSTSIGKLSGNNPSTVATVANSKKAAIAGDADFYAWGLSHDDNVNNNDQIQQTGNNTALVRAVGVQSFSFPSSKDPDRQLIVFAVNAFDRWSNAAANEFDIGVDVDGDGNDDYVIVGADQGAVQAGSANGVMGSFVFSTHSSGASISFLATTPTDSATVELPVFSSQLCRSKEPCLSKTSHPRITYHAVGFDRNGVSDIVNGSAKFNVWANAISTGGFAAAVAPGGSDTSTTISVNSAEWALTPAKGLMVVTFDNAAGTSETQLIDVKIK